MFFKNNFDNIKEHKDSISSDSTEITKKYFIIPYFNKISEKFKTITQKFDFKIAYKPMNTFVWILLKIGEDKIKKEDYSNVVYKK